MIPGNAGKGGRTAAPWVTRLLEAQGVTIPVETAYWWGWHLNRFLAYCRTHPLERGEVRLAARAYFDAISRSEPPTPQLQVDQLQKALTVFVRGVENWHWETDQAGAAEPRFRVKPRAEAGAATPRVPPPAPAAPQVPLAAAAEDLVARATTALRARHYAYRTEQTYLDWIRRFLAFHPAITPAELATGHLKSFLEHLAVARNVSSATQNQALSAVLFLYQTVLGHDPGRFEDVIRARRGRRLPTVLSREEVTGCSRQAAARQA